MLLKTSQDRMTPEQEEFYEHIKESSPTFMLDSDRSKKPSDPNKYPALAHLTTPAKRYKHMVETPNYYSKKVQDLTKDGSPRRRRKRSA